MTRKRTLYALAVVVLMGTMSVAALADDQGMNSYGSADAWELREAMETGALPSETVGSSDAVCCRGIDEPTIESGGQLFRPEIDTGS